MIDVAVVEAFLLLCYAFQRESKALGDRTALPVFRCATYFDLVERIIPEADGDEGVNGSGGNPLSRYIFGDPVADAGNLAPWFDGVKATGTTQGGAIVDRVLRASTGLVLMTSKSHKLVSIASGNGGIHPRQPLPQECAIGSNDSEELVAVFLIQ